MYASPNISANLSLLCECSSGQLSEENLRINFLLNHNLVARSLIHGYDSNKVLMKNTWLPEDTASPVDN